MAQPESSSGIIAGTITILGLGLVWLAIAINFPSREELSAVSLPAPARSPAGPSPSVVAPPTLDLTIPRSSPYPSVASVPRQEDDRPRDSSPSSSSGTRLNPRAAQVAKLRCEAEIEEVCPESYDGAARSRCLDQRAPQLSPLCQRQVREQLVRWKEDRSRVLAACEEDVKRFCQTNKTGNGAILQCLQSHAPEVSDHCYQTLPKGKLYFQ